MPVIGMPDGTQVSFPDEMPAEQIKGLISQKFPKEVASLAAPQQQAAPQPNGGDIVQKALEPITSYLPTQSQMAHESLDQAKRGIGQLQTAAAGEDIMGYPLSTGERAANVAYGVGNMGLGALGYVASPFNAALRTIAGKPIEENIGIPKEYTETALGFVVPVPGANVASVRTVSQAAPRILTAGERVVQAGQDLKNVGSSGAVNVPRAVASDSMTTQRAAATAANVPVAGNPLVEAAGNTTRQLATKSQEIAAEYGSASPITAGDAASTSIKNWIGPGSQSSVKAAYDKVDNLVDNSIRTDLSQTRGVAQSILSRRENANITEKSDAVRRIEEAVTNPSGLNYNGVKDLRTYIGELLDGKKILPADLRESELKLIYGGLSKDLRTAVENAGGKQALSAFERANKYNALVSDRRESLAKIVGSDGSATAAQVFDRLIGMAGNTTRADMSKLAQARKAMGPDSWNEVASGIISQMGRVQDATGNVIFSPQRFLTAYQDKLSPAGRSMLFRSAGKENIAPYLDDLATISSRFRELQKFSNPSGTGQTTAGFAGMAGVAIDPLTTVGAGIGVNLLSRALASPATLAPLTQWSRKYELVLRSPSPANVAQLTIASRNLANTLNSQLGASVQWQDLIRATQGSVKGRAENEQPEPVGVINQ